jgi:anion-transporting  ArsA/GET3 family ATPase
MLLKDSRTNSFLADSLKRKVIFFTGKGGVGKTAVAWATALALSRQKRKVRFVSWSPFESSSDPWALKSFGIPTEQLEALACFKEYALKTLKFEKFVDAVFENKVLKAFIQVAPGLSETVIAGKVWDLYDRAEQDTIIVDLPATGHALAFFKSPMGIEKMFATGFVHRQAGNICDMFVDPFTRLDVVTLPEEMPLVESAQFIDEVQQLGKFPLGYLLVNQCTPQLPLPSPLPKKLPSDIKECLEDYEIRMKREKAAIDGIKDLPLLLKQIPRFTTEAIKETIEQIADYLEK